MSIGRGFCHRIGADAAACTGTVVDNHRLRPLFIKLLAEHARDAALKRLAGLWGGGATGLIVDADRFLIVEAPGGGLQPAVADLAIFEARRRRAAAGVTLQQAATRTDPTWTAGPRYIGTGDVAVVGFDDIPAASLTNPPLTTVMQDLRGAGELLVEALLARIEGRASPTPVLATRLMVRRSTTG